MKKQILLLIGSAMALGGCGVHDALHFGGAGIQGSGVAKSESRTVGKFDTIEVTGSPNVKWTSGPVIKVVVKCDDNLFVHLKTEVKNGALTVYFDQNVSTKADTIVEITSPAIRGAKVTGSGDLSLSGIEANRFIAAVTGSGNLTLSGTAGAVEYKVTGSGNLDGSGLSSGEAGVSVTGSGNVEVNTTRTLDAKITGSGNIGYVGEPKVSQSVMGSGEVNKK